MELRIIDNTAAVAAMPNHKMDAAFLQLITGFHETLILLTGIANRIIIIFIRAGKVGKNTITAQIGILADLCDLFHRGIHVLIRFKSDSSHSGIYLNVAGNRHTRALRLLLELFRVLQRKYCLCNIVFAKLFCFVWWGCSQNQDRVIDSLIAQGHRLGKVGYRKPVHSQTNQLIRNILIPMSIGIRLDNTHNHAARLQLLFDGTDIIINTIQIHYCPAATKKVNHRYLPLFYYRKSQDNLPITSRNETILPGTYYNYTRIRQKIQ